MTPAWEQRVGSREGFTRPSPWGFSRNASLGLGFPTHKMEL